MQTTIFILTSRFRYSLNDHFPLSFRAKRGISLPDLLKKKEGFLASLGMTSRKCWAEINYGGSKQI
jgi:hypothetical protein